MGSTSHDNTQKTSADNTAAQQTALSNQAFQAYQKQYNNLFGSNGTSGAVGGMMNPNALNVSAPTGPQALQYRQQQQTTANQYKQAKQSLSDYMNSRGFGADTPAGFGATEDAALNRDEANQQGANFATATQQSYANALQNFWNAANLSQGIAGQNLAIANNALGGASGTYANLYRASAQPSIWNSIVPAIGTVGAAAIPAGGF